jgi:hypothetical protein
MNICYNLILPNIIEIRNTFTNENRINEALNWEKRVLDRLDAANRNDYLNKKNSKGINYSDPAVSIKRNENMKKAINLLAAKEKRKNTDLLPETKEKRRMAALKREADPVKKYNRLIKAFSQDAIDKRKKSLAITNQLPEIKEINNPNTTNHNVLVSIPNNFLPIPIAFVSSICFFTASNPCGLNFLVNSIIVEF